MAKSRSRQQVISTKAKYWSACAQFDFPGRHPAFTDVHTDHDIRAPHGCGATSPVSAQPPTLRAQLQRGRGLNPEVMDQAIATLLLQSSSPGTWTPKLRPCKMKLEGRGGFIKNHYWFVCWRGRRISTRCRATLQPGMATIKFWKLRLHFLHFVREHSHRLSPFFKSDISPLKPALLSRTADTVRLVQEWFVLFAHQFGSSEFPGSFKHYFAPINVTMAYFQVHLPPGSRLQFSVATTSLGGWWPQPGCVIRRSRFGLRDLTRRWW